ncbi:hypothetical protein [Oceanicola sp. S124]|uniref:hypothetical protein n=1 Tax=Oceanicola sp. S124 TaxID=1042378 RepID=UPI0002559A3A|nr:hypothetical protein [Oceanicola sp. S124]
MNTTMKAAATAVLTFALAAPALAGGNPQPNATGGSAGSKAASSSVASAAASAGSNVPGTVSLGAGIVAIYSGSSSVTLVGGADPAS